MIIENGDVSFGISIPLNKFNQLAEEHKRENRNTHIIEVSAIDLIREGFPDEPVKTFIKAVCTWGGYPGIAGRILNHNYNSLIKIREAFGDALRRLSATPIDLAGALASVNHLYGLGAPSFASKHLRFLDPKHCPVFDSILRKSLLYSFDSQGYASFASDCSLIANELKRLEIQNPFERRNGIWYVADVESALFIFCKNANGIT
jgi:hypothetical protein